MLLDTMNVIELCDDLGVTSEHFHIPAHATIFRVSLELHAERKPLDIILLTRALSERAKLDECGGPAYVTELMSFTPTAANAKHYIETIIEDWRRRKLIEAGTEIAARSYEPSEDIEEIESYAHGSLLQLTLTKGQENGAQTMAENVMAAMERLENIEQGVAPGLTTGLANLDKKLGGMRDGEVTLLMGPTGGGKTALAHNIAQHVAVELKKGVLIFSYEMTALWVTNRMLASHCRINTDCFTFGRFSHSELESLSRRNHELAKAPIFIDSRTLNITDLVKAARRRIATDKISLIIVDYVQKIPMGDTKNEASRQREVAKLSGALQSLAMDNNIPVLALAQHNRQGEAREAQDLEFDAKCVLQIKRTESCSVDEEGLTPPRDIVIVKNTMGAVGKASARLLKQFVTFEDYTPTQEEIEKWEAQKEKPKKKSWR